MTEPLRAFSDTTAVVTGASSGIGRATAVELARRGVNQMVVHFRKNQPGADQTVAQVKELGCSAIAFAADLQSAAETTRLVEFVWNQLGVVNTWINNAGADVLTGKAAQQSFESKLSELLNVDVVGTIRLSRLVVDRMKSQKSTPTLPSD